MLEKPPTPSSLLLDESVETLGLEIRGFFLQQSTFGHISVVGRVGNAGTRTNKVLGLFVVPHLIVSQSEVVKAFSPTNRLVAVDIWGKRLVWARSKITEGGEVPCSIPTPSTCCSLFGLLIRPQA